MAKPTHRRRVALNNLSFLTPGSERWTRLGNPLDFLTDKEWDELHPSLKSETRVSERPSCAWQPAGRMSS